MPSIDSFVAKNQSKIFKKKPYRPWTIVEAGAVNGIQNTGNQLDTNQIPISNQLDTNQIPISNQLDTNQIPKKSAVIGAEKISFEFKRLSGLQKNIVSFVANICVKNDNLISGPIPMKSLQTDLKTDSNTIKTALHRLVQKGLLGREKSKPGIGGFSSFKISPFLKQLIINNSKNGRVLEDELDTNPSTRSSSSTNILTTTKTDFSFLENEEETIDTSALTNIGFQKAHLKQLLKLQNLSPEMIQDSINAFAFDLEENRKSEKIKGSPLGYFMGILRKGLPYLPPENYEPPETRTLRQYIEQRERQKIAREELEKRRYELDLDDWIEKLSEEEIHKLIDEPRYRDKESPFRRGALGLYFRKNIWDPKNSNRNGHEE